MFVGGMSAISDSAEAVEGGNAESGGEIAVGSASGSAFTDRQTHLTCETLCAREKSCAVFALERGTVEAARDFEFCSSENRFEGVQFFFKAVHIGNAESAQVESCAGGFGDDIEPSAASDDVCVDGDAAAQIVPLRDLRDLEREFVNGVDAFLWREARVGSFAADEEFGFADAFAG